MLTLTSGKKSLQPGFEVICKVHGNLKEVYNASPVRIVPQTGVRWRELRYDICLSLGETEVTARLRWEENGEFKHGPAVVSYE